MIGGSFRGDAGASLSAAGAVLERSAVATASVFAGPATEAGSQRLERRSASLLALTTATHHAHSQLAAGDTFETAVGAKAGSEM